MIWQRLTQPVRSRVVAIAITVAVLIIAGGWVAVARGAHGYYTIAPGTAPSITSSASCKTSGGDLFLPNGAPCARLVVPSGLNHGLNGSLFMVDVLVGPATAGQYIESKLGLLHHFHDGMVLVPASSILGSTPSSQLNCQNDQMMQDSTSSAAVVALRRLGYKVAQNDLGAEITQVQPGTPASSAGLRCNDLVTAVNGAAVHTSDQLASDVHALSPGDAVRVTVSRINRGKQQSVTLTAHLSGTPAFPGQAAQPKKAFLGVAFETRTTFTFPFNVSIDVGQIGGPSAGLALTLGLLDVLSNGHLTGGHRIAVTGQINLDASVSPVGGVAQKAVAVRKAGAQYFIVPTSEVHDALGEAGSMKVLGVSSLEQALQDLKSIGGQVPPPSAGQTG